MSCKKPGFPGFFVNIESLKTKRFGNARRHYTGNVTGISGARPVAR